MFFNAPGANSWVIYYVPSAIYVNSISIRSSNNYGTTSCKVEASLTNSNYTTLGTVNMAVGTTGTLNVAQPDLSDYKYFKFTSLEGAGSRSGFRSISFNAYYYADGLPDFYNSVSLPKATSMNIPEGGDDRAITYLIKY